VINFFTENVKKPKLNYLIIKKWIKNVIESFDRKAGNISIIFCNDSFLLEYNQKYLQHNYFTDIITFNYNESNKISGDLFLSVDTIKSNSFEYNVTEEEEFLRVIIHGVLHLIGFNDHTDEEISQMRLMEKKSLELYNP
jgi:probable rRNA maturation factor